MRSVIVACLAASGALAACPPMGAVLPPPRSPGTHPAVRMAAADLTEAFLEDYRARFNSSAMSIGVKSIHQDEPLLDVHYTPPQLSGIGTTKVDKDTIYRVASVSKIIPVLLILQRSDVVDWRASVLEYIPELARTAGKGVHRTHWEDVTIESLAAQISGVARDITTDMGLLPGSYWTDLGLPPIEEGTGPTCSGYLGTRPCTQEDLLQNINDRAPIFYPFKGASYSNLAYALLGMVIERTTGKTIDELAREQLFEPVGMDSTSFFPPVPEFEERGFVAIGESTWNSTMGILEAAGGLFATTSELLDFGSAILSHDLLPPTQTRAWLKPAINTGTMHHQVGAPWEIIRVNNVTSDGRLLEVYAKSGDVGMYQAEFALIPDYDLVVSIMTAGVEGASGVETYTALSKILKQLLPAVEKAGRDEVSDPSRGGYTGLYRDAATNSTVRLGLDSGPGLAIEEMTMRGVDVPSNIAAYSIPAYFEANQTGKPTPPVPYVDARLYPTGIEAGHGCRKVSWRAVFDTISPEVQDAIDGVMAWPGLGCQTWIGIDARSYGYESLGELVFEGGGGIHDRGMKRLRVAAFDVSLEKVVDE